MDATLELFAKELVELWIPGITINGTTYRVGVVSGIFDGKGFEQVTKTQGSVSLQGCNACNFPGVWFGHGKSGSVVYPSYSRYLDLNDPRRLKRPLRVPYCNAMYNLATEVEVAPVDKSYANYIRDGSLFNASTDPKIKHINGVKGIWAFDILPYASLIMKTKDRMHTSQHVVEDSLRVLIPSKGYHSNRTEKASVRSACQEKRIFPVLYSVDENNKKLIIPWLLDKTTIEIHDTKLRSVIGAKKVEIPNKIMKRRKGRTTAESIMYATNGWAAWCLHSESNDAIDPYVDNILKLYDVIRILNSNKINLTDVDGIRNLAINALVEHSALFPPCEQTYALHELIHIVDQIPKIGPAKFNSLFTFERVNATLKRMMKNRCSSMPSIAKAYAVCNICFHFCCIFLALV